MKKLPKLLACSLLLTSCVAASNVNSSQDLASNEGIVVTHCKTHDYKDRFFTFFDSNFEPTILFPGPYRPKRILCSPDGNFAYIKMKASDYYIYLGTQAVPKDARDNLAKFTVEANKINYIGDINFDHVNKQILDTNKVHFYTVSISNNLQETKQRLMNQEPELVNKYELITSIAAK